MPDLCAYTLIAVDSPSTAIEDPSHHIFWLIIDQRERLFDQIWFKRRFRFRASACLEYLDPKSRGRLCITGTDRPKPALEYLDRRIKIPPFPCIQTRFQRVPCCRLTSVDQLGIRKVVEQLHGRYRLAPVPRVLESCRAARMDLDPLAQLDLREHRFPDDFVTERVILAVTPEPDQVVPSRRFERFVHRA